MFRDLILRPTMGFITSPSLFISAHGSPSSAQWSKPIDHSQRDIGVMVMRLVKILVAIGSLNREGQGSMVGHLQGKSATSDEDVFMPVKPLVLRIAGRKVVALVMKVQFELQMFQQVHLEADGREVMSIGNVIMKLNLVASFGQTLLIVIAQNHPCVVVDVIQKMRANPPQQGIAMGKRVIETANPGPSEQLDFPMFGEAMIQPDGTQMGSNTHVLEVRFGSMQFGLSEQLIRSCEVSESEDRLGCEAVDGFEIHRALAELGVFRIDKSAHPR